MPNKSCLQSSPSSCQLRTHMRRWDTLSELKHPSLTPAP